MIGGLRAARRLPYGLAMNPPTERQAACEIDWDVTFAAFSPLKIRYPSGELIYQTESYAAGIYFIVDGLVVEYAPRRVTSTLPQLMELLGPGDVIGLDALLERHGRLHLGSARALTEVELRFFERQAFLQMLADEPLLCRKCLDYLNHRLYTLKQAVAYPTDARCEERLCRLLIELAERFGKQQNEGEVLLPPGISADCLPELLGVSRRRGKRALSNLPQVRQTENRILVSIAALRNWLAEGATLPRGSLR